MKDKRVENAFKIIRRFNKEYRYIEIQETNNTFLMSKQEKKLPMKFGLNWSALGTQTEAESREFYNKMAEALGIINLVNGEELNSLDYYNVVYKK